jgi:hypothetical protein
VKLLRQATLRKGPMDPPYHTHTSRSLEPTSTSLNAGCSKMLTQDRGFCNSLPKGARVFVAKTVTNRSIDGLIDYARQQ